MQPMMKTLKERYPVTENDVATFKSLRFLGVVVFLIAVGRAVTYAYM